MRTCDVLVMKLLENARSVTHDKNDRGGIMSSKTNGTICVDA